MMHRFYLKLTEEEEAACEMIAQANGTDGVDGLIMEILQEAIKIIMGNEGPKEEKLM